MIKDIKIESLDRSKVNPDDEKFIKIIFKKDNRLDIEVENLSPEQIISAAKALAQAAAKLWVTSND